jgi:hypothetical protein
MPYIPKAPNTWSVAQHDTIPQVDFWLSPLETHAYLAAFLNAEDSQFVPPYTAVREKIADAVATLESRKRKGQSPTADVADSRIRTWRSTFENFGLIHINEGDVVELTRFGRAVRDLQRQLDKNIEGANDQLAHLGIQILNRFTLRNPIDSGTCPEDADIRPFNLIWRATRALNDQIHWEELNRVLMKVNYSSEIEAAIRHITDMRPAAGTGYRPADLEALGSPAVSEGEETKRRITPWLTRAGLGGLLISAADDERGFRHLNERYRPLIDDALNEPVVTPNSALASKEQYLTYLTSGPAKTSTVLVEDDEQMIERVLVAVRKYGHRRIICLSGLPGTGKSRLARLVADRISEGAEYRVEEIQFHENTSYNDFMEGFVPRPSGEGFELLPKVFRVLNRRASLDPSGRPFVLLIEELTRANLHAVLGELMTYIEHRDRKFRLALSQQEMSVSPNLVILATMNPHDKSALTLDNALLRRLHIIECRGGENALRVMLARRLSEPLLENLAQWFGRHGGALPFGHGVFDSVADEADLQSVWLGEVRHLLTDVTGAVRPEYEAAANDYPWK